MDLDQPIPQISDGFTRKHRNNRLNSKSKELRGVLWLGEIDDSIAYVAPMLRAVWDIEKVEMARETAIHHLKQQHLLGVLCKLFSLQKQRKETHPLGI